jgi:hypothetical protein
MSPPHEVAREIDVTTTLWRWDGLLSGTLVNLRIDAVYDDPDEVVLEWDSVDSRATQLEILRDDGVGVLTSAVTSRGAGATHHADVQPLAEYHYTVRSLANGERRQPRRSASAFLRPGLRLKRRDGSRPRSTSDSARPHSRR